jgi:hypothetical protein
LFTALIGPYFVDWASYRASFEREASTYVGRPVTIAGKASVRLLPTPVISFTDIRVGDADAPDVEMERFRAEVELASLLKGHVRVLQMALERPRFRVDIASLVANGPAEEGRWRLDPERISLERVEVEDGSAVISDSQNARTWQAEGIDALIEADTLMGPGKVTANLTLDGRQVEATIGFGRVTESAATLKASIRSPDYPVTVALDGEYRFPGAKPGEYEGTATVEGRPPAEGSVERSRWADFRASGKLTLTPTELALQEVNVSYGGTERPLILVASGKVGLATDPSFDLTLSARQIDIDRTLGGSGQPVAIGDAISTLVAELPELQSAPLPGKLHVDAQGVVLGGGVIQGVSADLLTGGEGWQVEALEATVPGDTLLKLNGELAFAPTASFQGHASLASTQLPAFAAWWRGSSGAPVRAGSFAAEADVDLEPYDQQFSNLTVATGEGTVSGSVDIRRFPQSEKLLIMVDLAADRADLVETQTLGELLASRLITPTAIEQMTLSLRADVLLAGGVEARDVSVDGGLEQGVLNIRRLSVADLAGATIDAFGSIRDPFTGERSGKIGGSVEASDLTGAAEFLASLVPEHEMIARLKAAAPVLAPVSARFSAEGGRVGEPLAVSLTGSFADTHLTLQANGTGSPADPSSLSGKVELHVDGADSAKVLRQLGLTTLPVRSTPLKIDASFDGQVSSAGKLAMKGTVAGVDLDFSGETSLSDGEVVLNGSVTASSDDIDQMLILAGTAPLGLEEGHAVSISGDMQYTKGQLSLSSGKGTLDEEPVEGTLQARISPALELSGSLKVPSASLPVLIGFASGIRPGILDAGWSDAALTTPLPPGTALDLTLETSSLELGAPMPAQDAKLRLTLQEGVLNLDLAGAEFAAGVLKGSFAATLRDGEAEVSLSGGLRGAELQPLVWEQRGLPAASGKIDLSLDASGRGRSVAGIISTLAGGGSFSVDKGRLNAVNGEALAAVMEGAEGEDQPDAEVARETFARLFDAGTLEFDRAAGTFSIAYGVVTIPKVSLSGGATGILAEGSLDLNNLTVASDWTVRTSGVDQDEAVAPSVDMRFSGPIAQPDRRIDVTPLLDLLNARFQQAQLDKIEEAERRNAEIAERERAEVERRATEARRDLEGLLGIPGVPAPGSSLPPAEDPIAEPSTTPSSTTTGSTIPGTVTPAEVTPPPAVADPAASNAAPAILDPSAIEIGPDLPPPESSEPIDLVPERTARPRRTRVVPVPAPAPAPPAPPPVEYRTLPNGTIVKIR